MTPNLVIAGVSKAGTTSLFRYLSDHPEICASNVKEIRFFTRYHGKIDAARLLEYKQYFPHWKGQRYRLEASPGYLPRADDISDEMRAYLPSDARLIFVLREPVSKLISDFTATQSKVGSIRPGMSFDEFVNISLGQGDLKTINDDMHLASRMASRVRGGIYAPSLRRFLESWPRDQIFIGFFEHLNANPRGFVTQLCHFLDIDSRPFVDYVFTVENKTRAPRLEGLHRAVHELNLRFEKQLNTLPIARRMMRSIYNTVATTGYVPSTRVSPVTRQRLAEFYDSSNTDLRKLCVNELALDVPEWLRSVRPAAVAPTFRR